MKAYSEDLRERIVHSVVSGQDIHEVAERFEVSSRTVWRYLRLQRERGHLHAGAHPGRPPKLNQAQQAALREQLQQHSGLTLEERVALLFEEQGVRLSRSSMQRWVKRLRYSRKKSPSAPLSATRPRGGAS